MVRIPMFSQVQRLEPLRFGKTVTPSKPSILNTDGSGHAFCTVQEMDFTPRCSRTSACAKGLHPFGEVVFSQNKTTPRDPITETEDGDGTKKYLSEEVIIHPNHHLIR